MSTATNSTSATIAPKGSATAEVRKSLHDHLRKTAGFIKILDLLVLMFFWICGGLTLWLTACIIDHWIVALPVIARWAFWIIGVGVTGWWLTTKIAPLLLRRINLIYAAKRIENLVPEFKNGLISWLELEELPENGVPKGVMAALAYRAKRYIGDQEPSATVDTSPLIKLIACMLLLVTGMVVYSMATPKSVAVTGQRILFPWSDLTSPARVSILNVEPGSTEVTQGQALDLNVEVNGLREDEPVFVRVTTLDGQIRDQRKELVAITEGFRYGGQVVTTGSGIEQELDYWIEAGDAQEGPFRVRINPLPTVVLKSVELTYPKYTGLKPRTIEAGAAVEAVEGTRATIVAEANQVLRKGVIEINPEVDEN
ncbi:MAG: hypothetical protein AAF483_27080, partial [Planctomycetota bacterium]